MIKTLIFAMCLSASAVEAEDLFGRVTSVDSNGVVHLHGNRRVMLWGLDELSISQLSDFLVSHWITCKVLTKIDGLALGDCSMSQYSGPPSISDEYLHLASWLPAFGLALPSCSVGNYGDVFFISRPANGEIRYGCLNGDPFIGTFIE